MDLHRPLLLLCLAAVPACTSIQGRSPQDPPRRHADGYVIERGVDRSSGTRVRSGREDTVIVRDEPQRLRGSFDIAVGARGLTDGDLWSPNETQGLLGVGISLRGSRSPLGIEFGGFVSASDDGPHRGIGRRRRSEMWEGYVGQRLTIDATDAIRPYLGVGVSFFGVRREIEEFGGFTFSQIDDEDSGVAGYARFGTQFDVSPNSFIGFDVRGLFGSEVNIFGVDGDANHIQGTVNVGLTW